MMTSAESPEGQLATRAGLSFSCAASMLQTQDFDFGKYQLGFRVCVMSGKPGRSVSVLLRF